MTALIDLKPVRRCGKCQRLIPADRTRCPYCSGEFVGIPHGVPRTCHPETSEPKERKPMSPETKKKMMIGAGVAAVAIIVLIVVNMIQGMYRLDKSILEPLDPNDVAAIIKDDPQFRKVYELTNTIREQVRTPEDKAKYGEITYKRLRDYMNYFGNKMYTDEQIEVFRKNYESEIHEPVKPKVDELVKKWQKFVEENDVNKYLEIQVQTSYTTDGWGTSHPAWYFVIKTPKGKLADCDVTVECKNPEQGYESYGTSTQHFGSLEELQEQVGRDNQKYWVNVTNSDFWNEYQMIPTINSVTLANGKVITADAANEVPETVKAYLDNKNADTEFAMIKELIDKTYPSENEYAAKQLEKKLQELDPLCYELLTKVSRATYTLPSISNDEGEDSYEE